VLGGEPVADGHDDGRQGAAQIAAHLVVGLKVAEDPAAGVRERDRGQRLAPGTGAGLVDTHGNTRYPDVTHACQRGRLIVGAERRQDRGAVSGPQHLRRQLPGRGGQARGRGARGVAFEHELELRVKRHPRFPSPACHP
jgi:hypothetical protein